MSAALMDNYRRADIAFERGDGPYLYTADGRAYLDFCSGIAVTCLGHAHPHLVKTLKDQAEKLWHTANLYEIPGQTRLAERLVATCFADRVFFCSTGVEALEGTIKLARRAQHVRGHSERWRVITVEGAFHGRSLATISASANPKYLDGFGPPVDGFDNVPFGNLNALRAAITEETAAILVEPIQGEGGIHAAKLDYLRGLRAAADEFDLFLAFDEVQSGNGRTGKMWAHQWAGAEPDIMSTAKGVGGGFPIGAILATEEASRGFTPGVHGTTFGGNQLAMAVGNAVLDVILEDGFLDNVDRLGKIMWDKVSDLVARYPAVFESLRGAGLMQGIKCVVTNTDLQAALRNEGLLTVTAGDNVTRLLPPLNIEERHIDEAVAILTKVAENWGGGDG